MEPCWEPQAAPKAGCFGKTSSSKHNHSIVPSGAAGKLKDTQHSNHLPNKQKEESCTTCDGQPRKGRSCDSPDPFGLCFSDLWEDFPLKTFTLMFKFAVISCFCLWLFTAAQGWLQQDPSVRDHFPQEMFLLLEAVLWFLGSSALSSRAAHWGPRCFLLLLCLQGFEEMVFFPGEIDRLHLTFKLSSRINLPLR